MRAHITLALAMTALLVPTVALGQDVATSPAPSVLPGDASDSAIAVAYSCVSYDPAVSDDLTRAISRNEWEVVPNSYCGLADVPSNFEPVSVNGVTVVPNDQFCNLVADDLEACEQALTTLASAGLLPEAFAPGG
ncbi:MAG: hypothetical protein R6W93_11635 [Candidatus Limnocylindrales bacterium]